MAITLDGNSIPLALVGLGITHNAASDTSSYSALVASWRSSAEVTVNGDTYVAVPTEAALQAEADSYETSATSPYADTMKAERLRLIREASDFRETYDRQKNFEGLTDAQRIAAADGISDAQYATVMAYVKSLADLPANIVADSVTYGTFENPTWPTKPAELG